MKNDLSNDPPALTTEERGRLGNLAQRTKLRAHVTMCREVLHLLRTGLVRSKEKAFAKVAVDHAGTLSADRLKKKFNAWLLEGERALIDHAMCGEIGCGFPDCGNRARGSRVPDAVLREWARIAEENRATMRTGTRSFKHAWRVILDMLYKGAVIGEFGDWRALWQLLHPLKATPNHCPWSSLHRPDGWSFSNFMLHKPRAAETAVAQRGLAVARKHLPQVRKDYSQLRPGEVVVIDDKRFDFKVWCVVDGKPQLVELWALVAMDAATRKVLRITLHPRYTRPDGSAQGIERRHVQHLLAGMWATVGVPRHWECEVVAENASAAVSAEFEGLVSNLFGGRVKIRRTGLWIGKSLVKGFAEHGGNPNGKAILESFFGHRLDVALGGIRGAMGANYLLKPGDFDARQQNALAVMKKLEGRATYEEFARVMPFDSIEKAVPQVREAIHFLENNREHKLQGFDDFHLWRPSLAADWEPVVGSAGLATLRGQFGDEFVNDLLRRDGLSWTGKESVSDRWARLYRGDDFERLGVEALHEVWLDVARTKYTGNGELCADLGRGRKIFFTGSDHLARAGDEVLLRFDADAPELGAILQTPDELRVLGKMRHQGRVLYGDEDALLERFKDQSKEQAKLLQGISSRHSSRDQLAALLADQDAQLLAIRTVEERTRLTMPDAATDDLTDAWTGQETAFEADRAERAQAATNHEEDARAERAARLAALG